VTKSGTMHPVSGHVNVNNGSITVIFICGDQVTTNQVYINLVDRARQRGPPQYLDTSSGSSIVAS
jgi:hypothetical protein